MIIIQKLVILIGHVNVTLSLFSNIDQSACSTLDWVLNNQSHFDWVLNIESLGISNTIEDISNVNMPYWEMHKYLIEHLMYSQMD